MGSLGQKASTGLGSAFQTLWSLPPISHFFPPSPALRIPTSVCLLPLWLNADLSFLCPSSPLWMYKYLAVSSIAKPVLNMSCCFHSFNGDFFPPSYSWHLFHSRGKTGRTRCVKSKLWLCRHVGLKTAGQMVFFVPLMCLLGWLVAGR